VNVGGDELFGLFALDGSDRVEKVEHLLGVSALEVEKVETVFDFTDVDGVFVSIVFENELFEVEEGSFVGDFLADLNTGAPSVGYRNVR